MQDVPSLARGWVFQVGHIFKSAIHAQCPGKIVPCIGGKHPACVVFIHISSQHKKTSKTQKNRTRRRGPLGPNCLAAPRYGDIWSIITGAFIGRPYYIACGCNEMPLTSPSRNNAPNCAISGQSVPEIRSVLGQTRNCFDLQFGLSWNICGGRCRRYPSAKSNGCRRAARRSVGLDQALLSLTKSAPRHWHHPCSSQKLAGPSSSLALIKIKEWCWNMHAKSDIRTACTYRGRPSEVPATS